MRATIRAEGRRSVGLVNVGIGVEPPLLADLLRRLLWAPDRQVYVHRPSTGTGGRACDVAVTSRSLDDVVTAPVRIQLPDDEGVGGWGTMIVHDRCSVVSIRSVDDILALIERGLAGSSRISQPS